MFGTANRGMDLRKGSNLEPIGPELFWGVDGLIVPKRLGVGAGGRKEVPFDLVDVDVLPRTGRRCRRHEARQARTRDPDCHVSRQSNRRGSNKPFGASSRTGEGLHFLVAVGRASKSNLEAAGLGETGDNLVQHPRLRHPQSPWREAALVVLSLWMK